MPWSCEQLAKFLPQTDPALREGTAACWQSAVLPGTALGAATNAHTKLLVCEGSGSPAETGHRPGVGVFPIRL